ncbi:armadillo repeat-containing protein 3-like isoform X3 [Mizuhopecten yessoensis]|uniref:Armadillo repeat-containing protein 3 n=1 Tax=Mizuhopecten yessoensis TaxID=6573 RepID=A0A210QJI7_MIZYE|nr:armadillo repeat-containing protein 3-like isoform X3 [Mizuhopecten yessoensis]OWF48938.1 Armadillo repeat-containing protein 3 [Mizuhopecten yessoensis]
MGKKVKEDKKPPPDDVFDVVALESRQAGTVVLMLNSPEEEVQAKACEAIYKFVEKCDENRKLLLDLGAGDPLLQLMQSEDRLVRRNACMAMGSMTAQPDVRKYLRKKDRSIPIFIALLAPEEDSVCHEFSALGLSNMATEFSSKSAIYENGGIEPLVKCLNSNDPDVQKNGIEALAQMMMDYQTRASIKDAEGLAPMLDLLKSDFQIVQKLALLALDRASQDADNRGALRELEAMSRLIDFVAKPELNDLHVMAVMVLSNLLEDLESLEEVKETGGLKRLVALITDQTPPEEEPKGGKGEKKAGSRAAKKSAKDGKKGGSEPEKDDTPPGEAIIPTLPDVKMSAAKAIARSARNSENRKILHEQEAEKMLIHLLAHESSEVQTAAAQALAVMSENLMSKDSIREWDGMQPLIKLLNSDNGDVKEGASLALANLTTSNSTNCQEVSNFGGTETLINLLTDPREEAVANAACVLTNMATEEALRVEAQGKGVVTTLIEGLKSKNTMVQAKTSLCIAAYVCDSDSRAEFRNASGIEHLVILLHSGNDEVRRNASWAITVCAVDEPTATEVCKLGGMDILQEIQVSGTRKNPFAEAALERLLDSNLSAKYALTGNLSSTNLTENGFYDAGQLRSGSKFMTLVDCCKQELNDKRAILLVNAKPAPAAQQSLTQQEVEVKQESSKTSVSGKSSRTGRESKAKSRSQRDKEEKQREEEMQAQLLKEAMSQGGRDSKPFESPSDPTLLKYMEEVIEKIQPIPSLHEQVITLARFVADKMGGPIEKGQLTNFSWELPIGQIKFELKSNVVPIGKIKTGIHIHRALLFKTLADQIAVPCTLTRGEYNRAWNEIMLPDSDPTPGAPKFPPLAYIVDLIHDPGHLMKSDSPEAITYRKL